MLDLPRLPAGVSQGQVLVRGWAPWLFCPSGRRQEAGWRGDVPLESGWGDLFHLGPVQEDPTLWVPDQGPTFWWAEGQKGALEKEGS